MQNLHSSEVKLSQADDKTLIFENSQTSLRYDLEGGFYSIHSADTGKSILELAHAKVNAIAFDGEAGRTWTSEAVEDTLGAGVQLSVTTPAIEGLELVQLFTLYAERSELVLGATVRNTSKETIRLKELALIDGAQIWPGLERDDTQTLDGMAGWDHFQETKTRVESGEIRWSYNNMLYTFKAEGRRHSLVFGGLRYRDFATIASVDAGVLRLYGEDPIGRRVDPGHLIELEDQYYIDGAKADVFEALEYYGRTVSVANEVSLKAYTFPTVCAWYAFGYFHGAGGTFYAQNPDAGNNTPTCVEEIDIAKQAGFLEYAPVAVRLVPDKYLGDTEQGWWDDEHWQQYGHYKEPYETSEKFCQAVLERGGLPFTYFQTGLPSDDFAEAFPEYMLNDDISELWKKHMHHLPYVTFDYTDPSFQEHLDIVWSNLRQAGMQGLMFDYPETAWRREGGFDDDTTSTAAAYLKVFEIAREGLGPDAFLQERNLGWPNVSNGDGHEMGTQDGDEVPIPVLDNAVGLVNSQRVMGDTVDFKPEQATRCGLRWYKCRTLFAYDMDAKAISADEEERRSMLTMAYVVAGRLLLGTSFAKMSPEMVHDLSRTFPYHTERKSARPLDLLQRSYPMVYDFDVNEDWHQLALYNGESVTEPVTLEVPLSGERVDGALGLDPVGKYYVYDFWNDAFVDKLSGSVTLTQTLRGGETRMLSVHRVQTVPQFISTNRHVMQGYLDLVRKPEWNADTQSLSGSSRVIANDPYELVVACNGEFPKSVGASSGEVTLGWKDEARGIAVLTITSDVSADIDWSIQF